MIRYGGSDDTGVKQLRELFPSVQYPVAPRGYPDLLLLVLVVGCANLELVGGRELDLGLFKLCKDIACLLLLQELIARSQIRQLVVLDLLDAHLETVHVDAVVQVTAPQQDVVLKQVVLLTRPRGEQERLLNLLHVLVAPLHF